MTKNGSLAQARAGAEVRRHAADQEAGTSGPAASSIHARIDDVVVLPCVPATASTQRSRSTCVASHSGPETYGMRLSSSASMTGCPRIITLPTTTTSGAGESCAASKPCVTLDAERFELRAHRRIDVAVGAGDAMAGGLRDGRDAAHERAADAEDMNDAR